MTDEDSASGRLGMFARLKAGLARTATQLSGGLTGVFTKERLDAETIQALEDALIRADVGTGLARELAAEVAKDRYDTNVTERELRRILADAIEKVLTPVAKPFVIDETRKPFVVLLTGVNGTGKTTTIGKLAAKLNAAGNRVWLAAGDTFRAAAIDQLKIWGDRAHAPVVARAPGSDAAGLAFDAFAEAEAAGADVLLIDTAGRMQNKTGLMAELQKIARVLKKRDDAAPHAAILVLDATTGQNAISQVEAFQAAVPLTGLIMTKLDGTAKGGILVALAHRFKLPIHFIGVGEGIADLQNFDASAFARALTGADEEPRQTMGSFRF
ncbi:MAG TPA: signal recognition particle-docking protein FtsY [Micropepsaceae bacterium]|jgi:fused signal recognition particle receptor|nr:signal recognition particle-docking protein FtsY [Micropepsaceae bacterium]